MKTRQAAIAFVSICVASPTYAQFVPVKPATCPATTEVNWSYNVSSAGQCTSNCSQDAGWMLPSDPNIPSNYLDNMSNYTLISGNEYIQQFGVRVNSFNMEYGYDYLLASDYDTGTALTGGANWGNPISGWVDLPATAVKSLPTDDFYLYFHSDYSVNDTGVYLDRARVCTNNPSMTLTNTEQYLAPAYRSSGVLLGTNDVAYFQVPVGSQKSGDTCSLAHDTFEMWGDPTGGNDFDLYVRCGAQPTPTQYDYRGFSTDTQEFVHATTASCPCGSQWHVAVVSYRGSGWFNVINHKHYASEHRSSITAGNWSHCPTITQPMLGQMQTQISQGFKHFFGANEGARFWDSIYFRTEPGDGDIRIFSCDSGRPNSDVCASGFLCAAGLEQCQVYIYGDWYDGPTISHELGHHINCLADEYEDSVGTECGHSIMGSQFHTNTNYCWCTNQPSGQNKCALGYGDHGWDPSPPGTTALKTGTAWINLASRAPYAPNGAIDFTPDNYDYTQFDFNGLYGTVTVE